MEIRTKRKLEWTVFSIMALILIIATSLFFYQNAYAGKIYKNITIASVDVSGKTKKQAESLLSKKFDSILAQDIKFAAGQRSVSAKIIETGLGFDITGSVERAYAVGRSQHFIPQLYASASTAIQSSKIPVAIKVDNTKLGLFIAEKLPELNVAPQDATISITNNQVAIVAEQSGQQINTSNLAADLSKLISSGTKQLTINLQIVSSTPRITSQDLESQKTVAEAMTSAKLTLNYLDKSFTPTGADISNWITIANDSDNVPKVALDDNKIKSYLTRIAKDFEIIKKDRKINAATNVVIEEGLQGLYLDKDRASTDIKFALSKGSSSAITLNTYTEDPKEIKVFPNEGITPGRYTGKYIDVDLAQQKLCRIESNNILDCFTISSGKASTPTPTGTRYIDSKETKRWSAPYGLWMPYWQSLGGGYGIHELPEWPNGYKEGESHLGTPVSHGCVRLGVGTAELVFNWTDVGTPVYIHK